MDRGHSSSPPPLPMAVLSRLCQRSSWNLRSNWLFPQPVPPKPVFGRNLSGLGDSSGDDGGFGANVINVWGGGEGCCTCRGTRVGGGGVRGDLVPMLFSCLFLGIPPLLFSVYLYPPPRPRHWPGHWFQRAFGGVRHHQGPHPRPCSH